MKDQIIKFWRDEEGATAIEYGLIAGLISIGIIAGTTGIGTKLGDIFTKIKTTLQGVVTT
ncbi:MULTISPECIES: Flp family type IVb pilin [Comamonas]|uniref:Flp/Fap pilin protein n=1 Tax=Comamonas thiooxydans TaxID=363952 RepID=A0A0E3BM11_9BURK|nr:MULTISPECIES: Flp family type IVb pilin [Comamonas]KGH01009.1 Flp/Fap pilin protein [Comamonas thiooxydans]MBL5977118.1 Flp family type IVb pilin [Comamonas sp. NyZ500]MDO1475999.1 Flp family type IVb pilin [Comamonas thiooxydans]